MAGFLPNVPGVRIPYHRDGSLVKIITTTAGGYTPTGTWSTVSSANAAEMNDGDYVTWEFLTGSTYGQLFAIVFPQAVTLTGHNLIIQQFQITASSLWTSTDTTDGTDGAWISETSSVSTIQSPQEYRSISSVNIPNVKGVRFGIYGSGACWARMSDFQLYGLWDPQTLAAWHPTLDQQIDGHHLDFGDVLLGNVYNKQFRIKNGRALTANNVVVSCTTGTAEFISGLTFSLDGTTFTSNVTVPSIAPGAISGTVYVRRTVSAGQSANILAMAPIDFVATTWT